ncbi:MAG: type II secretion system protein [Planctomycetota bacterium]|jgi:prepilin-type N-terminal cleavage/methylation domain-containing protein
MKRKGFTLIELLVVIAIIALLMSILMPALARVRELAQRTVCGTNCSGIVKAMVVYANDDQTGRFPRAGIRSTKWGPTPAWDGGNSGTLDEAFDTTNTSGNSASITASLFLLVKRDYTTPKQFLCKSDTEVHEFRMGDHPPGPPPAGQDLMSVFDFGPGGSEHVSYAYHMPYFIEDATTSYALTAARDPGLAVVADGNPEGSDPSNPQPLPWDADLENCQPHQGDGQNVAFVDTHVDFEPERSCGFDDDDIYSHWNAVTWNGPAERVDSYLVNQRNLN